MSYQCPICDQPWEDCACTFEQLPQAIRAKAIDEVAILAADHKGMFATETACKQFIVKVWDLKEKS